MGMLHQGLKVKKLNHFSKCKPVVCDLCGIGMKVIEILENGEFSIETGVNSKI